MKTGSFHAPAAITTNAWNGENVMALKEFTTPHFHSQFQHSGNMPGARRPGDCLVEAPSQAVSQICPPATGLRNECPGIK